MGKKIFVSYKYADSDVEALASNPWNTTVRDYVNAIEETLNSTDDIYKGEHDNEDLSSFKEETIQSKLKDKIYDSSITIVLISPNMKDPLKPESDQWIPWEISYSLKEISRTNSAGKPVTSKTNGILAVVLPDKSGSYEYYLHKCSNAENCTENCVTHETGKIFNIIRKNKFNKISKDRVSCGKGFHYYRGEVSYIESVKWNSFVKNMSTYIDAAADRQNRKSEFELYKKVD